MSFKKKAKVAYTTPRGAQTGTGTITEVIETARGLWYAVKDAASGKTIKLRAANLSLV